MVTVHMNRFGKDQSGNDVFLVMAIDTMEDDYIAISHIWREDLCDWREVKGPGRIYVSAQKANFIENELPRLVGEMPFWMDVISVDQENDNDKSQVVKLIPDIYSHALETIVVKEDHGLNEKCGPFIQYYIPFFCHGLNIEYNGTERVAVESGWTTERWLHRFWPLQEVYLSSNIQFVVCRDTGVRSQHDSPEESVSGHDMSPPKTYEQKLEDLEFEVFELIQTARIWAKDGYIDKEEFDGKDSIVGSQLELSYNACGFIMAFLSNEDFEKTTINQLAPMPRKQRYNYDLEMIHNFFEFWISSRRKTSKPRDFVLAWVPIFSWFHAEDDIRDRNFGNLFAYSAVKLGDHEIKHPADKNEKGVRAKVSLQAKITRGVLKNFRVPNKDSRKPAMNIPIPSCLGDFCDLFTPRGSRYQKLPWDKEDRGKPEDNGKWVLLDIDEIGNIEDLLELIGTTLFHADTNIDNKRLTEKDFQTEILKSFNLSQPEGEHLSQVIYQIIMHFSNHRTEVRTAWRTNRHAFIWIYGWEALKLMVQGFNLNLLRIFVFIVTHVACDLSINFMDWCNKELKPYILRRVTDPHVHPANVTTKFNFQTLILAAPDLQARFKIQREGWPSLCFGAYGKSAPWLTAQYSQVPLLDAVIGLTPRYRKTVHDLNSEYVSDIFKGRPYAIRKQGSRAMSKKQLMKAYLEATMGCVNTNLRCAESDLKYPLSFDQSFVKEIVQRCTTGANEEDAIFLETVDANQWQLLEGHITTRIKEIDMAKKRTRAKYVTIKKFDPMDCTMDV